MSFVETENNFMTTEHMKPLFLRQFDNNTALLSFSHIRYFYVHRARLRVGGVDDTVGFVRKPVENCH